MRSFLKAFFLCLKIALLCASIKPSFSAIKAKTHPWFRLPGEAYNMKMGPKGRHIAFTNGKGQGLKFLVIKSKKIYQITANKTGGSYFFSPDGYRVFFRELLKEKGKIKSVLKVYNIKAHKSTKIDKVDGLSGFLTFDPRDLRFQLMHGKGILSKMIVFPDKRLAKWQLAQRTEQGKWLATTKGILWLTHSGFTMRMLKDDKSGVQSFSISPDGSSIVWATKDAGIYHSELGKKAKKIGEGYDPSFHPRKPIVAYAGVRKIGTKVIGSDIRVVDLADPAGSGRWVTSSLSKSERWPQFMAKGEAMIYTLFKTTDIFYLELKP